MMIRDRHRSNCLHSYRQWLPQIMDRHVYSVINSYMMYGTRLGIYVRRLTCYVFWLVKAIKYIIFKKRKAIKYKIYFNR